MQEDSARLHVAAAVSAAVVASRCSAAPGCHLGRWTSLQRGPFLLVVLLKIHSSLLYNPSLKCTHISTSCVLFINMIGGIFVIYKPD